MGASIKAADIFAEKKAYSGSSGVQQLMNRVENFEMTSFHWGIKAFVLVAFLSLVASESLANKIYQIVGYPADQNGHAIEGTITTDGTLGFLAESNLVAYEYTITGPNGYSDSSDESLADFDFDLPLSPILSATNEELLFDASLPGSERRFRLGASSFFLLPVLEWSAGPAVSLPFYSASPSSGIQTWLTFSPTMNSSSNWLVGKAVPEPGCVSLAFLASLFMLGKRQFARV